MWVEKYRPLNPNTIIGNEEVRIQFINWLKNWTKKSKPALLLGPPGIGKTTVVYATANSLGYEVIDLNASDVRTKTRLEEKIGPTRLHTALFDQKLLIFLDEVDGIYGRQDKGGLEFIQLLIKKSEKPLVMVANVEDDKRIIRLVKSSSVFKFQRIPPKLIELVIKNILERESIKISKESIEEIVKSSKGDVRSAINIAQVTSAGKGEVLSTFHDQELGLKESLNLFFSSSTRKQAYLALRWCKSQPRDKIRAIYNSIMSKDIEISKLIIILNELSTADKLIYQIIKTQNYRLLRYFDQIIAGVLFDEVKGLQIRYNEQRIPFNLQLRIWNESRLLGNIASKISKQYYVSKRDAMNLFLPYILLICNKKNNQENLIENFKLDEAESKVFMKEMSRIVREVSMI